MSLHIPTSITLGMPLRIKKAPFPGPFAFIAIDRLFCRMLHDFALDDRQDQQSAVAGIDPDRAAIQDVAGQEFFGQFVLKGALDDAL